MRVSKIETAAITGISLAALLAISLLGGESEPTGTGKIRVEPAPAAEVAEAFPVKPAQVAAAASGGPAVEVSETDPELPLGADPSGSVDESLTEEEMMEARREKIREYFAERRAKMNIVATTRTSSGQEFDWIPREAVDKAGNPVTPPPQIGTEGERDIEFEHRELGDHLALTELDQTTGPLELSLILRIYPGDP